MSIDQQISENEKTFQEWFQRSWDAHHKENPSATDFKDVGDPRPTMRQKSYDYLDKRTVRVMVDFQSRPDDFVQLLQDYLINNALLLYQDSIRIANLPGSVSFYKDCGDQVGMVECQLSREGQIVTVAIGYQIYTKIAKQFAEPPKTCLLEANTYLRTAQIRCIDNKLKVFDRKGCFASLVMVLFFPSIVILLLFSELLLTLPEIVGGPVVFLAFILSLASPFVARDYLSKKIEEQRNLESQRPIHLQSDLSHTFFPVAYYSNEEVTAAQTQNKDHAAFLERIRSVIDRAVAFGESSHNQRT